MILTGIARLCFVSMAAHYKYNKGKHDQSWDASNHSRPAVTLDHWWHFFCFLQSSPITCHWYNSCKRTVIWKSNQLSILTAHSWTYQFDTLWPGCKILGVTFSSSTSWFLGFSEYQQQTTNTFAKKYNPNPLQVTMGIRIRKS